MRDETTAQLRGYYDAEAPTYDGTRGGRERATRAAAGFARLLGEPGGLPGPLVEVGVGTGAVSAALTEVGLDVAGLDISLGMLRVAATRLPGRVFQADGRDLPLADASCGAVLLSWVLHLVPDAEPLVAEAARVLAPGGVLVSTVDKSAAGYHAAGRHVPAPGERSEATDAPGLLDRLCAVRGLEVVGETTYDAVGQVGTPTYRVRAWRSTSPSTRSTAISMTTRAGLGRGSR